MPITKERTGWRDEGISNRHREWGVGCTATDFDFLLLEYEFGEPSAIVEYKNEHAAPQYSSNVQYRALVKLGNSAKIPVIVCRYSDDYSHYVAVALNKYAREFIPNGRAEFDEAGWVKLLYDIRGSKQLEALEVAM